VLHGNGAEFPGLQSAGEVRRLCFGGISFDTPFRPLLAGKGAFITVGTMILAKQRCLTEALLKHAFHTTMLTVWPAF
jgi:hypothetical protein